LLSKEQQEQRQPKKQKSISRADAKKIDLDQFREKGTISSFDQLQNAGHNKNESSV
jgi:hypothetical protein